MTKAIHRVGLKAVLASVLLAGLGVPPAIAQESREIAVENRCNRPIRVLIHHADQTRSWHPHAWFNFAAGEGPTALTSDGVTLRQLTDHELYFYAESTDRRLVWEGNDSATTVGGQSYGLVKANTRVQRGRTQVTISCPGA